MMVVTSGRQYYNIGEKPTVILYTYINRHARTPEKQGKQVDLTDSKEGSPPTCSSFPCASYVPPLLRLLSGEQRYLVFSGLLVYVEDIAADPFNDRGGEGM